MSSDWNIQALHGRAFLRSLLRICNPAMSCGFFKKCCSQLFLAWRCMFCHEGKKLRRVSFNFRYMDVQFFLLFSAHCIAPHCHCRLSFEFNIKKDNELIVELSRRTKGPFTRWDISWDIPWDILWYSVSSTKVRHLHEKSHGLSVGLTEYYGISHVMSHSGIRPCKRALSDRV
jgi:hypothetical protein